MLSDPLAEKDLPEIKKAVVKFRDDLKKHLKDGKPIGNFKGTSALEEALREPRDGMRPYEADNLRRAELPRDLKRAIISLWKKCWRYGTISEQLDLRDAIDEVLQKDDGYVMANKLWMGRFPTYYKFGKFLERHPEIPQETRGQRRMVHAAKCLEAIAKENLVAFVQLDDDNPDTPVVPDRVDTEAYLKNARKIAGSIKTTKPQE